MMVIKGKGGGSKRPVIILRGKCRLTLCEKIKEVFFIKKYLVIFLALLLCLSFSAVAMADEAKSVVSSSTIKDTHLFSDKLTIDPPEVEINGPKYHYRSEYLEHEIVTVSGFAGNQLSGGYQFPTGGGFWYSDSGGPSVTGSISLSLPAPFDMLSFSVNLGKSATSGLFVNAPNTTDYFKLYVVKTVEVSPYVVYRAPSGTEDWEIDHIGSTRTVLSSSASAVKVN